MVRFELKLEDNLISAWAEYYLDYSGLKKSLKKSTQARERLLRGNPSKFHGVVGSVQQRLAKLAAGIITPDASPPSTSGVGEDDKPYPAGEDSERSRLLVERAMSSVQYAAFESQESVFAHSSSMKSRRMHHRRAFCGAILLPLR